MFTVGASAKPCGTGGAPFRPVTVSTQACASGLTVLGAVGPTGRPKIQLIPIRIRLTPMTRMIEPVTTGGKKRISRDISGAISIAITPAAMIAPNSIRAPSGPGLASAIETIGPTEAKVTPIITGSLTPNHGVSP